jgi:hypothetical protein
MAILKRRTKLVSFRLSDEEYERVQGACMAEGARSISEYARAALQRTTATAATKTNFLQAPVPSSVQPGTQELIDTMRELTRQLGQLASLIRSDR